MLRWILSSILLLVVLQQAGGADVPPYQFGPEGKLNGELKKWHKITLGFTGPATSETNGTNPFTDYRLDVTFTHVETQKPYVVPGYYACDGNAANSGADSGAVWLVNFAPDETGTWEWQTSFVQGENVAQNGGGTVDPLINGLSDSFVVQPTDKKGRDHRGKGRLQYVGAHHLRFSESGEWFLKAGADSPENHLAYAEFDNTLNVTGHLKTWAPHKQDFVASVDPTWAGGNGTGIIGATNYLSEKGMNVFSFLPMNIDGDDKSVYPYISDRAADRLRMDCSKLAQWEVVFEHADRMGMFLHFKTQEQENDQLLDGGELGNERKLYYRELIARFSHHLALNWNLGEENTNTNDQRKQFSDFIKAQDPYKHPIISHTLPDQTERENVYVPLLGYPTFDGASVHADPANNVIFESVLQWVQRSAAAGKKWIVSNDEQSSPSVGVMPDSADPTHDSIRKSSLWATIMAGGAGVEYYFGYAYPHSDMTCEDYRSRDIMWDQSRYALKFFQDYAIPFWNMTNANDRVTSNSWCLAETNDEVIVMYIHDGGTAAIDTNFPYLISWYDPRNGGVLQFGSKTLLPAGKAQELGTAPNNPSMDWVVLLKQCPDCPQSQPSPPQPQHVPSSDDETQTGLIAGLVAGSVVVVSIALYLGLRHSHRQRPRSRKKKPGRNPPEPVDDLVHPSDIPVRSDPPASSGTGTRSSEHNRSIETGSFDKGPEYKDQVRPSSSPNTPSPAHIPTVAAMEVDQRDDDQEAQACYRMEL